MNQQEKNMPEQWGEADKKNPSQIARKLQSIRNESTRKFKLIDVNFNPKNYIKQEVEEYKD